MLKIKLTPNAISSTFDRRSNPNQIYWCAPGSQTYITFTYVANVAGNGLQEMIDQAYSYIVGHVALEGDGLVPDGGFDWDNFGFSLRTWNANNHQMTWGVLGAAAFALMDYMNRYGYGSATFLIYDGVNQVGAGTIE